MKLIDIMERAQEYSAGEEPWSQQKIFDVASSISVIELRSRLSNAMGLYLDNYTNVYAVKQYLDGSYSADMDNGVVQVIGYDGSKIDIGITQFPPHVIEQTGGVKPLTFN